MKKTQRSVVKNKKTEIKPAMHYSVMLALIISNITSLGLAFLMAQLVGVSMGNIAQIGEMQRINKAYAQVYGEARSRNVLGSNTVTPLPQPSQNCETYWADCSAVCDEEYTEGNLTRVGWNSCERDCDLKLMRCEKTGNWSGAIQVRDTNFNPDIRQR